MHQVCELYLRTGMQCGLDAYPMWAIPRLQCCAHHCWGSLSHELTASQMGSGSLVIRSGSSEIQQMLRSATAAGQRQLRPDELIRKFSTAAVADSTSRPGHASSKSCLPAGWTQDKDNGELRSPKDGGQPEKVTILRRFHFSSSLKRMSCIIKVRCSTFNGHACWLATMQTLTCKQVLGVMMLCEAMHWHPSEL